MLKSTLPLRSRQGHLLRRQNGELETPGADSLWNNTGGTPPAPGLLSLLSLLGLNKPGCWGAGHWVPLRRQPSHAGASVQVTSSPLA